MSRFDHSYTIDQIKEALQQPADGLAYQKRMIPVGRKLTPSEEQRNQMKHSAVLVLLQEGVQGIEVLFTQRKMNLKHHPGQISFPGGRRDASDRNAVETALRETSEEIGIEVSKIEIIGQLSPVFVMVSNYWVEPIVGYLRNHQTPKINPEEVETVFAQSFDRFVTKNFQKTALVETNSGPLEVPCYEVDSFRIWGATAMILAELTGRVSDFWDHRMAINSSNVHSST
jgi:8-oxo-dGTP pyrophosphatase MutT (NUDIX family)